ncbi:glycosyltransferase family 1 protein [Mucilaginibacter sp. McL0603]|uniref:glycosyltransferase family 1 protein n=1 Tax=Mucilaginibacter sp. McL0603 TaxID=3415670 RepID=UPI003CE6A749
MTEAGKTLVILSPGFPKDEADTACIPPQQVFVKNLKQNYPDLNVIVLAFEYPFYSSQYQWNGVTVISFGGRNKGKLVRLRNWVRIWLTLQRLNKQYQIIGLLSFWISDCAFVANAFAKKNNLKHFCWILGQDAKPGNKYFRRIKPDGGSLIALSDFISKEINKNYSVKPARVIPVGIDAKLFSCSSGERDIDILAAGSLIPLKQFSVLINIVGILNVYFPGIKVVICGDGPERESLNEMVKEHRLENNVQFTGELPHQSVLELMQRTKIFAHPSAYEGFGVVCLEALYAGAQVVSFVRPMDCKIKNWHFTNSQDGMLNVIKELLENPASDNNPVTPFLIDDTCKSIMELFD